MTAKAYFIFYEATMIYLFLAMISSASMTLALRSGEKFSKSNYGILLGNYLLCTILAFLFLPEKVLFPAGSGTARLLGHIDGTVFLLGLILMQVNIRKSGAVLTAVFSRLGVMIPVIASILFLDETPRLVQLLGIALVVFAILIMNIRTSASLHNEEGTTPKTLLLLLLLFIVNGSGESMSKIVEQAVDRRFDGIFLLFTFSTAFFLSLLLYGVDRIRGGQRMSAAEFLVGIMIGIPNYFCSMMLLKAVTQLPAFLVYPSYSVGAILIVSLVSVLVLHDTMSRKQRTGCGIILLALVFLNI